MVSSMDNEWFHMGTFEKILTWIRIIVMLIVAILITCTYLIILPDFLLISHDKLQDDFYPYYEEQYDYLEDTVENILDIRDQKLDVAMLPTDILFQLTHREEGITIHLYLYHTEEISMDLELSEDYVVKSISSNRQSKDDYQEQLREDINSFLGIFILLAFFSLICYISFIYESVTFVLYLYDRYA